MTVSALIFDCDGTLVNSELIHAEVEVEYIRERFGHELPLVAHNKRFTGVALDVMYAALEAEFGHALPPDFHGTLMGRKKEAFSRRVVAAPGMIEILPQLAGYRRCVASNAGLVLVEASLRSAQLYDFFAPAIYSAEMVERAKPAPDLFLYAARQMKADIADCLVIEDSAAGVKAAKAAGIRVFGYTGCTHDRSDCAEILAGADLIFDDMKRLPDLLKNL